MLCGANEFLHGRRVGIEADRILHEGASLLGIEWFVVGKESAWFGKIGLGLVIVTTVNGVVRALEQAVFAVLHKLERWLHGGSAEARQLITRYYDGSRDIVLHLNLERGMKILAQAKGAP